MILTDNFGRVFKYLRVSVTDRCNYKCRYCAPYGSFNHVNRDKILRYEDMLFVIGVLTQHGLKKVRITGGEPLVRKGLIAFIEEINKIEGIKEITLTTNGSLLGIYAKALRKAGIKRINISLDSLQANKYAYITGGFNLNEIIQNIKLAKESGFDPVKINTVMIKGFNDDEILDFCEFAKTSNSIVRFIEFMPVGNIEWSYSKVISGENILKTINTKYETTMINDHTGASTNYKLSNGAIIGIISPVTHHFCEMCDKLRLLADGSIKPCLLMDREIDLYNVIKSRDGDLFIKSLIEVLKLKNKEHAPFVGNNLTNKNKPMSSIGG
jgi:cyclic pyranopterin phosphate synthase